MNNTTISRGEEVPGRKRCISARASVSGTSENRRALAGVRAVEVALVREGSTNNGLKIVAVVKGLDILSGDVP